MSFKKVTFSVVFAMMLIGSALGAANASALSIHLETCKEKPTAEFTAAKYTSATCTTESSTGTFTKQEVSSVTSATVVNPSAFLFETSPGGSTFHISCAGLSATSSPKVVGETVEASGFKFSFSGCKVVKPESQTASCVVKGGGGTAGTVIFNELKAVTTRTGAGTYKTVLTPKSGESFVTLEISGCTTTFFNGSKVITGSATGQIGADGMKTVFSSTSGSALSIGGQVLQFTGSFELDEAGGNFVSVGE